MLKKQSQQHKSRTISATIIQIGSSQSCSNPPPPVSTLTLLGTKKQQQDTWFSHPLSTKCPPVNSNTTQVARFSFPP